MTNLEKIKNIIQSSELKDNEKKNFIKALSILAVMEDKDLSDLVTLLEKEPEWVPILYYNLMAKRLAAKINDPKLWQQIFKMEKEMFEKIEKSA